MWTDIKGQEEVLDRRKDIMFLDREHHTDINPKLIYKYVLSY